MWKNLYFLDTRNCGNLHVLACILKPALSSVQSLAALYRPIQYFILNQLLCIKGEVPLYTEDSLILSSQQHNCTTRYSNINFICPRFNRMTEGGSHSELLLVNLEQLKFRTQEFCIIRIF